MLGWKGIGDWNLREGGRRGYSGGKVRWQRKLPPGKHNGRQHPARVMKVGEEGYLPP